MLGGQSPEDHGDREMEQKIEDVYATSGVAEARKRYQALVQALHTRWERTPSVVGRCPGRVNLIGDHVDYSGFNVLPMALDGFDCLVAAACEPRPDLSSDRVHVCNVDGQYEAAEWEGRDMSVLKGASWSRYVAAALVALRDVEPISSTAPARELWLVVSGNVPVAAGLSSSSALLCASTLVLSRILLRSSLTRFEYAEFCAKAERLIGAEGGGMDQAIGFLGQRGFAKRIDFHPLKAGSVRLPPTGVWVVLDSLAVAEKFSTPQSPYNLRAVECRLAAAVMAARRELPEAGRIRTLRELFGAGGYERLVDFEQDVAKYLSRLPYSLTDVAQELGIPEAEVRAKYLGVFQGTESLPDFQLLKRAKHVVSETIRVYHMENLCGRELYEDQLEDMGELLEESHKSAQTDFECSCEELDVLVDVCRANGAYGARVTGAGWGGCVVALVAAERVAPFVKAVSQEYYSAFASSRQNLKSFPVGKVPVYIATAGEGAGLISPSDISVNKSNL